MEKDKIRRQRIRAAVIALFGGKCARCDFSDARALQIDHVDGGGQKELKQGPLKMYRRILRTMDTAGYQLLCANCNWVKRFERGEHGGGRRRALYD